MKYLLKSRRRGLELRDLVLIGVLAAMCAIATALKVPFGNGAMVHLGTGALYLVAILFGGAYAGLAGAIGSAFYDLLLGFSPYTLWSFAIKGGAGLLAGWIARGVWPEGIVGPRWLAKAVLGMLVAAVWTLLGYFFAWWFVLGSREMAAVNVPGSLFTSGVGFVFALLLAPRLRKILRKL